MNRRTLGITPSQVVAGLAGGGAAALAFLQANSVHIPQWVLWVMAALTWIAASCRSVLSSNNGGANDAKAAAVHASDPPAGRAS